MNKITDLIKSLFHNPQSYKLIIYILSITFSIILIYATGWNSSVKPIIKLFLITFFIFIDLIGQYCLSLGKYYYKIKSSWYFLYFAVFGIYICVFNIPSAILFISSEISVNDSVIATKIATKDDLNLQLLQLNTRISNQNNAIAFETKTGAGKNFYQLNSDLNTMISNQKELSEKLNNSSDKVTDKPKDYFYPLTKVFTFLSESTIKFIMYYVAVSLMVFSMIITCPAFPEELVERKKENKSDIKLFVNNLFRPSGSLNGLEAISKITGMTISECRKHQKRLIELGMIESGLGGAKAVKTLDEILEALR